MTQMITFANEGISYQIRIKERGASVVAFGPGSERRATIIDDLDLSDLTENYDVLAGICEAALKAE